MKFARITSQQKKLSKIDSLKINEKFFYLCYANPKDNKKFYTMVVQTFYSSFQISKTLIIYIYISIVCFLISKVNSF